MYDAMQDYIRFHIDLFCIYRNFMVEAESITKMHSGQGS